MAVVDKITGVEPERQYTTIHPKVHAHVMLTQMNIREGLLTFGEKGNQAILEELRHLHFKKALMPTKKTDMPYEERIRALMYLILLK